MVKSPQKVNMEVVILEIKRDKYLRDLINRMHNGMVKVVTGIRRSGKSYLVFHIFKEYLLENGVTESHIISIELDQRKNKQYRDPDTILDYIDGKKELREINMEFNARFVRGEDMPGRAGCGY